MATPTQPTFSTYISAIVIGGYKSPTWTFERQGDKTIARIVNQEGKENLLLIQDIQTTEEIFEASMNDVTFIQLLKPYLASVATSPHPMSRIALLLRLRPSLQLPILEMVLKDAEPWIIEEVVYQAIMRGNKRVARAFLHRVQPTERLKGAAWLMGCQEIMVAF